VPVASALLAAPISCGPPAPPPLSLNQVSAAEGVVPALKEWAPDDGTLLLSSEFRVAVDVRQQTPLIETADTFRADLAAISGLSLPFTTATTGRDGDIYLSMGANDPGLGDEGYLLEIGNGVSVRANSVAGVFYGLQTVLQMLQQDPSKMTLPRGRARDYPTQAIRGLMIDAGRKYWEMEYLERTIRQLAWRKMNYLHLHFTEWSAFRLVSDSYPGLAAEEAYTKEDIRRIQDVARHYHVMIVPEIDLPAHATAITDFNPDLAFQCESLRRAQWQGDDANEDNRAWLLDVTRQEVRDWISVLLDEFVPLFDGPYFHIGGDEWQYDEDKMACPELVAAMQAAGYSRPGDLFVEWINEANEQVKSYGKQTQIWNWWRYSPDIQRQNVTSIQPSGDILVNVWNAPRQDAILAEGFDVILSPGSGEGALYVSPGFGGTEPGDYGFFDSRFIYEDWEPLVHPQVRGYKMCIWADRVERRSDEWFDRHADWPKAVLADRLWGGPRSASYEQFQSRVARIGPAPAIVW
jgi:hexosaminidase